MKASIVIPSYNAEERLKLNLIALNNQDYDGDAEVIVVDNGSKDNTMKLVENFKLKYPLTALRVEKNKGIANARNYGISRAKGEVLIFHDSDMIASESFLTQHISAHTSDDIVVCGLFWQRIFTYYYEDFTEERKNSIETYTNSFKKQKLKDKSLIIPNAEKMSFHELEQHSFELENDFITGTKQILQRYGTLEDYPIPWRFFITNTLSVLRSRVMTVGMLDDKIIKYGFEDYDLGYRLFKDGLKIVFAKDIVSLHQEHPQNYIYHDVVENINYICDKYDDTEYIDMQLVCLGECVQLDGDKLDDIVKEVQQITLKKQHEILLELYLLLLRTFRAKCFRETEIDIDENFLRIARDMPNIVPAVLVLWHSHEADTFITHLCNMLRHLYKINLDEIIGMELHYD
ncbi:MAG: glycosyltransferase family 2 protein [Clostridiales bacterium]|nr:glycosyltransferase family 2 protein [Clostridiales bacterium]